MVMFVVVASYALYLCCKINLTSVVAALFSTFCKFCAEKINFHNCLDMFLQEFSVELSMQVFFVEVKV